MKWIYLKRLSSACSLSFTNLSDVGFLWLTKHIACDLVLAFSKVVRKSNSKLHNSFLFYFWDSNCLYWPYNLFLKKCFTIYDALGFYIDHIIYFSFLTFLLSCVLWFQLYYTHFLLLIDVNLYAKSCKCLDGNEEHPWFEWLQIIMYKFFNRSRYY
jgi:hypothetical protein